MDDKISALVETAVTNDVAAARKKVDDAIKAQFASIRGPEGPLTVVGGLMARALVDKVYTDSPRDVAKRIYGLRGVTGKSDASQIGKLANFNIVAMAWKRGGIDLVEGLVKQSEGDGRRRYRVVQTVLVELKKRAKVNRRKPSNTELGEMLAAARTGNTPDNTPAGKLARKRARIAKALALTLKDHPEFASKTLEDFVEEFTPRSEEP